MNGNRKNWKNNVKNKKKIEEIKRQYNSQMESVKSSEPIKLDTVKAQNISSFMPKKSST